MNTQKLVVASAALLLLGALATVNGEAADDGVARAEIEKLAISLGDDAKTFVDAGNGKRCDIVWGKYAIIVARAPDWDASVGRALSCGVRLRKTPALLLLVADDREWSSVREAAVVARRYQVALDVVEKHGRSPRAVLAVPELLNVNTASAEELEVLPAGSVPPLRGRFSRSGRNDCLCPSRTFCG